MLLNFAEALKKLGPNAAFRIINEARPPAFYLLATLLPEINRPTYDIKSGHMVVRSTMAGLAPMDGPLPPGGFIESGTFMQESAKLGNNVVLGEQQLREIQALMQQLQGSEGSDAKKLAAEALNFYQKAVIQPHFDTMEYLRSQALMTGEIDWTYNQMNLKIDYQVPSGNFLTNRTGNDAYHGSASKFWADIKSLKKILKNVRAYICHTDTIQSVIDNDVNKVEVLSDEGGVYRLTRLVGTTERRSTDARESVQIITYDAEGEMIDPTDPAKTITVPYISAGKIIGIGDNNRSGYVVGQGSSDDPDADKALGYTHVAPTVEGGQPGRWGRLYTPEERPWQLVGEAVTNGLPVIEAPKKIAVASTDMPA